MTITTAFTKLTGCRVPIQQASMGVIAGPKLAAAVSNAGGLGMLSAEGLSVPRLEETLSEMLDHTSSPFGVNFLVPFIDDVTCIDVAARRARLVEFFYGEPDTSLVERVHRSGALAFWQVGSVREAVAAVQVGVDAVVIQGLEAGGHLRGDTGLWRLLAEAVDCVRIPIVAAGGIGSAEAVEKALASGAAGVRAGTRFIAESEAHPMYAAALMRARAEDTIVTTTFSRGWPNAPHRVLRSCVEAVQRVTSDVIAEYQDRGARKTIHRFSGTEPTVEMSGQINAMALYAGESVTHVRGRQTAESIVGELLTHIACDLQRWSRERAE